MPRTPNGGWYTLRYQILERDAYTCRYCGRTAPSVPLEVDHVLAVADGGTDDPSNLVTCCWSCNRGKEGLRARRSGRSAPKQRITAATKKEVRAFPQIPCGECGLPSDTLHIVPWVGPQWNDEVQRWVPPTIRVACKQHDPDGYWFEIEDLTNEAEALHWLRHLGEKNGRPDRLLAEWLRDFPVIDSLKWTLRCSHCSNDYKWTATDVCTRCHEDICNRCMDSHLAKCDGTESDPPSQEFKVIKIGSLLSTPPPVYAMWNGKRNY